MYKIIFNYKLVKDFLATKKSLVIVDMQNDFISESFASSLTSLNHSETNIIPIINKVTEYHDHFDLIAFTKDWHPSNHLSFHSNRMKYADLISGNKEPLTDIPVLSKVQFNFQDGRTFDQILWPDHCIQNSFGSEIHVDIKQDYPHIIILKGDDPLKESYSCFRTDSNDPEVNLHNIMTFFGIKTVVMCGIALDYCVKHSALDASSLGYNTIVLEDAVYSISSQIDDIINELKEKNISFIKSDELIMHLTSINQE